MASAAVKVCTGCTKTVDCVDVAPAAVDVAPAAVDVAPAAVDQTNSRLRMHTMKLDGVGEPWHDGCVYRKVKAVKSTLIPQWAFGQHCVCIRTQITDAKDPTAKSRSPKDLSLCEAIIVARYFPDLEAGKAGKDRVWHSIVYTIGGGVQECTTLSSIIPKITEGLIFMGTTWVDYKDEAQVGACALRASYGRMKASENLALGMVRTQEIMMQFLHDSLPCLFVGKNDTDILSIIFRLVVGVPYIGVADDAWYTDDTKKEMLRNRLRVVGRYQDHIEACDLLNGIGIPVKYPVFPNLTRSN